MKIKIVDSNKEQIERELEAVNGKATEHTYTEYDQIKQLADKAIKQIYRVIGSKKDCVGATITSSSGYPVANRYKYSRKATFVKILVNAKLEAFLVAVAEDCVYADGGKSSIKYTCEQQEIIKNRALAMAQRLF